MNELLYLLPPGMEHHGADWGLTPAYMAYELAAGPRLLALGLTPEVRDGAMVIACPADPGEGDPTGVCRQVTAECRRRGFQQVICDLEGAPVGGLERLCPALERACSQSGLILSLPEPFAPLAPGCRVLVSSALASGTLERRLRDAIGRYGAERVTLAVEAVAEDFPLPAAGRGETLTQEQLHDLILRLEPAVFFDRGLCAHYFTYMDRGGKAHFVLFDTARSVREKLDTAQRLDISSALLAAPQVDGWLGDIFGE
jgi:hypothetical protein